MICPSAAPGTASIPPESQCTSHSHLYQLGKMGPAHSHHACATSPLGSISLAEETQMRFRRQFFLGTSLCTLSTWLQFCLILITNFPTRLIQQLRLHNRFLGNHTKKKHSCMLQHSLLSTYLQLKTTEPH